MDIRLKDRLYKSMAENSLSKFFDFDSFYQVNLLSDVKPHFLCDLCRRVMKDASQLNCGCRYCYQCIKSHLLTSNQCPGKTLTCQSQQVIIFPDNAVNREIGELKVRCTHCDCKRKMKDMKLHLESCGPQFVRELVQESRNNVVQRNAQVVSLIQGSVKKNKEKYRWKIHNFPKILNEAKQHDDTVYYKDCFYTDFGYRIKLLIYPNGKGIYRNSHLSVGYMLVEGDNDHSLTWPFGLELTFGMADQRGTGAVHEIKIPSDRTATCNKKPCGENVENGIVNFLSLADGNQIIVTFSVSDPM